MPITSQCIASFDPIHLRSDCLPLAALEERRQIPRCGTTQSNLADEWRISTGLSTFATTTSFRVLEAEKDLAQYVSGNRLEAALLNASTVLSATYRNWEMNILFRQNISASAHRDALLVAKSYFESKTLPHGENLALDSKVNLVRLRGIGFARSQALTPALQFLPLHLTLGGNFYELSRFTKFEALGTILRSGANYIVDGSAKLRDSSRAIDGFGVAGTNGYGFGIDIGAAWRFNEKGSLSLSVVDAWSKMKIPNLSAQIATFQSDSKIVDDLGFLSTRPAVEGYIAGETLNFRLNPVITWAISQSWLWEIGSLSSNAAPSKSIVTTGFKFQRSQGVHLHTAWASTSITPACNAIIEFESAHESKGFGLSCERWSAMLRSNSRDFMRSKSLGFSLLFSHGFKF